MTRLSRTELKRQLKYLFTLVTVFLTTAGTLFAACTASEKNADYSAVGSGTSSSLTAKINAAGDLVAITAWCYPSCSPTSVKLGSQTAVQTTVSGAPGPGNPGTGQGFIFYILSAAASGSQTLTFTASGGAAQTQVSYIDFTATAGCTFSHDTDSPLGQSSGDPNDTGSSGVINAPSIAATAGDVLFNFTWSSEHINDISSPWSCPVYSGSGETQDCQFDNTRNVAAYILSAPSGSVANNTTDTHGSDSWQALLTSFSVSGSSSSSSNGCPSSAPVTGNHCYFIAANGSDSNSGTSESSPWQHAPGMPNCAANCKAHTPAAGEGFIFRGGDTWHFGNSSLSPYTGGTWDMYSSTWGNGATCIGFGLPTSGCIYYGVDQNWFSGNAWARPVLTGDNPASTSLVGSCAHQVPNTGAYVTNTLVSLAPNTIFDSFELTGLCSQNGSPTSGSTDTYVANLTSGTSGTGMGIESNLYIHGWTATATAGTVGNNWAGTVLGGGFNGLQSFDRIVIDGSDSNPGSFAWATFPSFYHMRDSIVRYTGQGVGQWCHDIHDNIFEHMYNHNPGAGSHSNILECNTDNTGDAPNEPQNTPNVFYNNIVRHDDASYVGSGQVHLWFCPESIPEYWFNNLMYDVALGNNWDYAGPPIYGCSNTGGQFMFNNTLVDVTQPCYVSNVNHGGQYLTVLDEHLINTPYDSGSTSCTGKTDPTNVTMSDAQAITLGYLSGSPGTSNSSTCANEATTPCAPTLVTSATVAAGANHMAYCTALASYTSEPAIGTEAANACRYGTTDACSYSLSAHTMNCPGQSPVARPTTTAWDAGAYQYSSSQVKAVQPPTGLAATVN
ncbi:MAG TPA: hypothetical protein VMW38_22415 [Terriglobia bacterium]|nr:hypothetical protein [Terriglobia bacterium]